MKLRPAITGMLVALTANIEYLQRHGNTQIKLHDGQLTETAGDIFIYQFAIPPLQRIKPDTEVEIRLENISANGKVVASAGATVRVDVGKYLGDKVASATLVVSNYQLLQILRDRLEKMQSGDVKIGKLASKVFDGDDFALQAQKSYTPPPTADKPLNPYQLEAVRAALGSPVSFIWGPPGTGKTQTIASIIEGYLSQGKSTLLISHTNLATDEALYKTIVHLGGDNKDYSDGKIVRFGSISLPDLKDKFISPDQIVAAQSKTLQEKMQDLNRKTRRLKRQTAAATKALEDLAQIQELEHRATELNRYIETKQRIATTFDNSVQSKRRELARLRRAIARQPSNHLWQLLTRRKVQLTRERILSAEQYIVNRSEQLQELRKKIQAAEHEKTEAQSKKSSAQEQAPKDTNAHYRKIIERNNAQLQQIRRKQSNIRGQLAEMKEKVILDATVVATTLTKSYTSKSILARDYDCVILDEASMALLPAILCASALAKQHVVIVGDFLQLPPVVQYKTDAPDSHEARAVHDWLIRDIFTIAGIEQSIREGKGPQKMLQLKQQYRMQASIAEVVNHVAYGRFGEAYSLKTAASETADRWPHLLQTAPSPNAHVAFYDTSERDSRAIRASNGSCYNLHNALVCIALATEAQKNGYTSIGIVSAYRAQANLLQSILVDNSQDDLGIEADTVHRFQGGEKQLIIIDITTPSTTSLYANPRDNTAVKLLNVAISRAQEKCLLVGNLRSITQNHSSESPILQVIKLLIDKQYPVYKTQDILKEFQESEQTDTWLEALSPGSMDTIDSGPTTLVDETDFYGQFMRDMLAAEHEVIIESPYMTTRRINELLPYFEHLRRKGIEIYILTRSPLDHDDVMRQYARSEISRLSTLGIKVLALPGKVHRKLAVLDRHILWEGSLNILSQNDSREAMWRTAGPHAAQQIMQFLNLDKNLGQIDKPTLQHCQFCTEPEAWYWAERGKDGGSRTLCLFRRHTPDTPPLGMSQLMSVPGMNLTCPTHNRRLIRRTGRYGDFFGCPLYPACNITRSSPDIVTT